MVTSSRAPPPHSPCRARYNYRTFVTDDADNSGGVASSSFGEAKFKSLVASHPQCASALSEWCRSRIARIYPAGHRVDSSNYDPSLSWALGCQVVALNCQAKDSDEQLYVNYGKFLANGRCGYVLKPEYLRGENCGAFAAKAIEKTLPIRASLKLTIQGAKGWTGGWGRESSPDVYCRARVAGGPPQDCRDWWKTKTVQNSVAPQWDAEFTQALAAPELCVVVLECWDDDTVTGDDFLGTVAVPLAEVASGKQLDLPLLAATLAPWPRKHGAPSLQVTFDLVYADARGPSGGLA